MALEMERPLVVLDLETTGTNPRADRIVEFAGLKLHPDGRREALVLRINPERLIPSESRAIHGISDADVADEPTFGKVCYRILRFLGGCDLAGFGIIRFDVPLLQAECRRAGVDFNAADAGLVDAQRIYHQREPRTLSAALRFYCGEEHDQAHSAEGDVEATLKVLEAQLEKYTDLPRSVRALDEICNPRDPDAVDPEGKIRWSDGEAVIAFGQKSGISLRELAEKESGYLRWILNKDFSTEIKAIVRDALAGKFPTR